MAKSCYKKLFICEVRGNWNDYILDCDVVKTIMKTRILGVVTGIQKFSRKIIYAVDDGTGSLDCVLWHHESASTKKMDSCISKLNSGGWANKIMGSDSDTCKLFLTKIQINEEEADYSHGDLMCCLGTVKTVKGKLLLDINHHYKANNMNAESLWILDVLSSHQCG